ncbi:hypothetical protein ACPVPU_06875 [Sphingomonas sp. CJ99]
MSERQPNITPAGYDRIYGLHPFVFFGAVVMMQLLFIALIVTALLAGIDWTEDLIWPGGPELLPF